MKVLEDFFFSVLVMQFANTVLAEQSAKWDSLLILEMWSVSQI